METSVLEGRKIETTTSICSKCKHGVTAEIWEIDNKIFMEKSCDKHGKEKVLLASDAAWYHDMMSYPAVLKAPKIAKNEVKTGCPYDCGACTSHQQQTYLPVVPITSACNLDCPICYTINKNDGAYHMSLDEFAKILDVINNNDPDLRIINFTGGEPTLHPQFTEIIRMCHKAGIHRITISTHGLTFLKNEALLAELAELRARIVLSFNSFEEAVNKKMLGANVFSSKMKVLEKLEKYNIDTTLIPVLALGYNDREIGDLVNLLLTKDFLRSLEIHTMTFTGQGGTGFDETARLTTPDILNYIEEATGGNIALKDFLPSPCAHPMCYQTCYLLQAEGNQFIPFSRFMSKEKIRHMLTDNLYMEPGEKTEKILEEVMMDLWSMEMPEETGELVLKTLKQLVRKLFPSHPITYAEQQIISERSTKAIYIHSHMDEHNFDTNRIRQCCVGVPSADGGNTPTCSYNILYRSRDNRFAHSEMPGIDTYKNGKKW